MEQTQPLKKRVVELPSTTAASGHRPPHRMSRIPNPEHEYFVPIAKIRGQIQPSDLIPWLSMSQQQRQPQRHQSSHPYRQPQRSPETEPQRPPQLDLQRPPQLDLQRPTPMRPPRPPQMDLPRTAQTDQQMTSQTVPPRPPQLQQQRSPEPQQPIQLQYRSQSQSQNQSQTQSQVQTQVQTQPPSVGAFIEIQNSQDQQPADTNIQIIEHVYKEPPMMLNAWTQTIPEDQSRATQLSSDLQNAVLLAKIETLQESLKESYDYINANLNATTTPTEEMDENDATPTTPPVVKNEVQTYTILPQRYDYISDDNIEIELSVDTDQANDENSPPSPKVYNIRAAPNSGTPKNVKIEISPTKLEVLDGSTKPIEAAITYISIGPNDTQVPELEFNKMSWATASIATRRLLTLVFSRETLATHSMTGKASPAFKDLNKPVKGRLDPHAVQDIICVVSEKCGVSPKEVRSAITTKCADENKMLKLKEMKRISADPTRPILGELRPKNSGQTRKSNGK